MLTPLQAPFELQSRRSVGQLEPTETKVSPYEITGRNIQRERPLRNLREAVVQL
jgi:hypothetical protein